MKKELFEVVNRFKSINKYVDNLLTEQSLPEPEPDPNELTGGTGPAPEANAAGGEETPPPLPPGDETDTSASTPSDSEQKEPNDGVTDELPEPSADDSTEEIDVTDLYNMTKNIKQDLDSKQDNNGAVTQKMDGVFQKLNDLENSLKQMDTVIQKIDQLSGKIEQMKPPTPQEKLEMRSLDSYPFSQKPQEFFDQKLPEMQRSHKNEYVLTKSDVQNYSKNDIMRSFNPDLNY